MPICASGSDRRLLEPTTTRLNANLTAKPWTMPMENLSELDAAGSSLIVQ